MIRVLLVDDHTLVREGTRSLLEREADIRVVAEAGTAAAAFRALADREHGGEGDAGDGGVDVVLLDLGLPDQNGVEVAERMAARHPHTAIVVLTAHTAPQYRLRLLDVGVTAYLDKGCASAELLATVRAAALGAHVLPRQNLAAVRAWSRRDRPRLTARELEVLGKVAEGLANKEIAGTLLVSERTVEYHMGNIMSKLDVRSRVQAVRRAQELGWLVP